MIHGDRTSNYRLGVLFVALIGVLLACGSDSDSDGADSSAASTGQQSQGDPADEFWVEPKDVLAAGRSHSRFALLARDAAPDDMAPDMVDAVAAYCDFIWSLGRRHAKRLHLYHVERRLRSLRRAVTESVTRELLWKPGKRSAPQRLEVFLSHAKRDGRDIAEALRDGFAAYGQLRVWYDANDLPAGYAWGGPMRKAARKMAYVQVPGVGHAPMLDEPEARAAIFEFLAGVK